MTKVVQAAEFFVVGGPVQPDRLAYVERAADRELGAALRARRLCYVLGAHGTGKSSLLARAARSLREDGELVALVDLASLEARGEDSDVERWTYSIAHRVVHELRLSVDLPSWWRERTAISRESRLADFFWDVVLTNTTTAVTIMFDEIERAIELPFGRELLTAIETCHERRTREPDYGRLTFALAGVATSDQLVRRTVRAPTVLVEPADFTPEEAYVLAPGFGGEPAQTQALMDRVCVWTNGHPYLTQQVARLVANKGGRLEDVERVVHEQVLVPTALNQKPLASVRERLTERRPAARRALGALRRLARGGKVTPPRDAEVRNVLLLSGVATVKDGALGYRNRIVREAFGARWVKSVAPLGWRTFAAAAAAAAVLAAAGYAYWNYVPQYYERVLVDPHADPAAVDAAYDGLHRLPGFAARADDLLAQALRRRSSGATNVDALVSTDTALRALPGQTQAADRLLADFWLRKTAMAAEAEQRDPALLFALRAALAGGGGAEEARAWVGALVGDDYAELTRTFDLASAPPRWGVDWQSGQLLVEADHGIRRVPLAQPAKAADAPLALSALAYAPLERAVRVEDDGAAGEVELSVALAHPKSGELTLTLTAPSGASATVPLPQSTGGHGEYYVFTAQPGTPLAALSTVERHGTWKLALVDHREGSDGTLVGWGLRFGEQSVRDDPDQPVAIPDPTRTTDVAFDVSNDERFALVRPSKVGFGSALALWDLGAGRLQADFELSPGSENIQLNATHTRLLTSAGDQVELYNAASGMRVARLATQTEFVLPAVFSADGGFVGIAERVEDSPPLLSLLRAEDGTLLSSIAGASGAERWWLGPGGRYFALLEPNNVVHVIDARRGTDLASLEHSRPITAVLPLPDGATLLTIDDAGEIRGWRVDPAAPASASGTGRPLGTTAATSAVSLSADGTRVAYPTSRGEFVVRAVASGGRIATVRMNDVAGAPRARLSPDGGTLVTSLGEHVRVWSPLKGEPLPSGERAADLDLSALAIDAPSNGIALGRRAGGVTFADAPDSSSRTTLLADAADGGPHAGVRALALAGALGLVASGGDDGVVRLVALPSSSAAAVAEPRTFDAGDGPINAVAFGAGLVAAAAKTAVHVWSVADGTAAFSIPIAAEAVAIAPGGELIATGGAGGTVQVWRRNGGPLGASLSVPSAVHWLGFGSDGVLLAATDRWLHSFRVGSGGLEVLHAWPAPGSLSAARGYAALGAERARVESFNARGELRRSEIDLAVPSGAPSAPPELSSRDWPAALALTVDDEGEVVSASR
jgi:WD40 repeat protein